MDEKSQILLSEEMSGAVAAPSEVPKIILRHTILPDDLIEYRHKKEGSDAPSPEEEQLLSRDIQLKRAKARFEKIFIDPLPQLSDFMHSDALEGLVNEKNTGHFEDYFMSSARDPANARFYYGRLRVALLNAGDTDPEDAKGNVWKCMEKYTERLTRDYTVERQKITDEALAEKFKHKFSNAEMVAADFMTNRIFTNNYAGYPNTHIFLKCLQSHALEPDAYDEHYMQLEREFAQFNMKHYPSKTLLHKIINKAINALEVDLKILGHASEESTPPDHLLDVEL